MSNHVIKKTIFYINVVLKSPISISGGEEDLTDHDVIRDFEGNPFIPGSSLAGAMRGYLQKEKYEDCVFGYSKHENAKDIGRMSSIYVSDLTFVADTVRTSIRDSVALSSDKTAKTNAKFDMEVIDSGAKGYFILEWILRANDDEVDMKKQLQMVFSGWNQREIRLGSKKMRGYGELKIISIKEKEYTKDNIEEYKFAYQSQDTFEDVTEKWLISDFEKRYLLLEVPLRLKGGISIRQYAAKKGEPDYVHITANGQPVIPGTSMMGAIRHRIIKILQELSLSEEKIASIMEEIVGVVKEKEAKISSVIVDESIIKNAKELVTVRNGISRFEAGTKEGALFKELIWVDGEMILTVHIRRKETDSAIIGFLLLALKDLQNGYLAVGGQTAIGKGLFEKNGEIKVEGKEIDEEYYLKETANYLCGV